MHLYVGILGSFFCIVALAITLFKSDFGASNQYKILNFFGGGCLLYYALVTNSVPFIILETIWVLLPLAAFINKKFCITSKIKNKS